MDVVDNGHRAEAAERGMRAAVIVERSMKPGRAAMRAALVV